MGCCAPAQQPPDDVLPSSHPYLIILQAFLLTDDKKANELFEEAAKSFKLACKADPTSEMYKKALQMSERAPVVYKDL